MKRWKVLRGTITYMLILVLLACEGPGVFPHESPTPAPPTPTAETSVPIESEQTPVPIEDLTLTGNIVLPPGSTLVPTDLRIATNIGTVPVNALGDFSAPAMRGVENTTLAIALNAQGNAVLLRATRGAGTLASGDLSVASTALALVLFDPAILGLPPDLQDQVVALYKQDVSYPMLEEAVGTALLADPIDPLNADTHPDLFRISGEIVAGMLPLFEATGRIPIPDGGGEAWTILPANFAPAAATTLVDEDYVFVTDDAEARTPEVILNNRSWSYYEVKVSRNGQEWQTFEINRNKIYTYVTHWPPGYYQSQEISPGDADLEFVFTKDSDLTMLDLFLSGIMHLTGIPAGNVVSLKADMAFLLTYHQEAFRTLRDIISIIKRSKGKDFTQCSKDVAVALAAHATLLAIAGFAIVARHQANLNAKDYVPLLTQFFGEKYAWMIVVGYVAADLGPPAWSIANAPETVTIRGRQEAGIYPAVTLQSEPEEINNAVLGQHYYLNLQGTHIPKYIRNVRFELRAEGMPVQMETRGQTGYIAVARVERTYAGEKQVEIRMLDDDTGRRLASLIVPVTAAALAPTEITGPGGGVWVQAGVIRVDRTPAPEATPDPLCYWNPIFADESYSDRQGCIEPPLGTAGSAPYELKHKVTWTLPPKAMTPGDVVTLTLEAEASATLPSMEPRLYLWVDIPNWGADVTPPTPFGESGLTPPMTRVTLISPGKTNVRFRVRPGVEGEMVEIAMQVSLSLYKMNPGPPVESRRFQYVYHTR